MTAPPLYLMLAAARAEYAAETPLRIHTSHAPKLLDADGVTSHYPDEGGLGLPFTAEIHRLLALRERSGSDFLMRRSVDEVTDWCRSKHPEHVSPETGATLCGALVWISVVGHAEPDIVALVTQRPAASVRSLLTGALAHAAEWRYERRSRAGTPEDSFAEETLKERLIRQHDLDHERRAWNLLRLKYPVMVDWDDEYERRQAEHQRLGCEACPMGKAA